MNTRNLILAIAAASATCAPAAMAGGVLFQDTLNTTFFPGDGNSNTNFVTNRFSDGTNTIELGVKAKARFGGDTLATTQNRYSVQPGLQQTTPPRWTWNFDFSLDLRGRNLDHTRVDLIISFDDVANTTVSSSAFGAQILGFDDNELNDINPDPTWSGTDGLVQNSWNLGFGFLNPFNVFDPNAIGTYTITFNVYDIANPTPTFLGGVSMEAVVQVIPLPGTAGLTLAGMGLIGIRRRR